MGRHEKLPVIVASLLANEAARSGPVRQFLERLSSEAAAKVFREYGFIVLIQ